MFVPQEIFSLINKRKLVYSKSKMTFGDSKNSNFTNCFPVFQFQDTLLHLKTIFSANIYLLWGNEITKKITAVIFCKHIMLSIFGRIWISSKFAYF